MSREGTLRQRDQAPKRSRLRQVAIVGAGPAGLGCAAALKEFGVNDITILDRHDVGASFQMWPQEMRLLTPSFTSNAFGLLDLNAIIPGTSPAYTLDREHPSGTDYAKYLGAVAEHYRLPVKPGVDVCSLTPENNGTFTLTTTGQPVRARHVIWAAGEFQYPELHPFPGADSCCHSSEVRTWQELEGDRFTVIGGYESAADAAVALVRLEKNVTVLARTATWLGFLDGLIECDEDGALVVTEEADESTLVPGLFISGPILEHRGVNFCFIYKFRQRFAVVADAIAQRLGKDTTEAVAARRAAGMYLDDLSCCAESCAC